MQNTQIIGFAGSACAAIALIVLHLQGAGCTAERTGDTLAKVNCMTFTNAAYRMTFTNTAYWTAIEEIRVIAGMETNIHGHLYRDVIVRYHRVGCPCGGKP